MSRNTFLSVLLLALLATIISIAENTENNKGPFTVNAQTSSPSDETLKIERVTLSKNKVALACPYVENTGYARYDSEVDVLTEISGNDSIKPEYYYTVSGGEIVGEGERVVWKFSFPGTYRITVGIGKDGIIIGETVSKTIEVVDAPICHEPPCNCGSLELKLSAESVKAGEVFQVKAEVTGSDAPQLYKYIWSISAGEIIAGQETSQITVKTAPDIKEEEILVQVTAVASKENCECNLEAAETVKIIRPER